MNRKLIAILVVSFFLLPLIFTQEPNSTEPDNNILPSILFYFTIVNGLQDLIEVILWYLVFKEFYQVRKLRRTT